MGILSEQNILGNPALAIATRPGADTVAADYAFPAPMVYQMEEGNIVNPGFMTPSSYSFDKSVGSVTKSDATGAYTGVDGESITFAEAATQYGPPAGNQLADSQGTNLTSAAEVIAGKAEPVENVTTISSQTATESDRNKTVQAGTGVAVASGAPTPSYSENAIYNINKSSFAGDMAANDAAMAVAQGDTSEAPADPWAGDMAANDAARAEKPALPGDTTPATKTNFVHPMWRLMPDDGAPGAGTQGGTALSMADRMAAAQANRNS